MYNLAPHVVAVKYTCILWVGSVPHLWHSFSMHTEWWTPYVGERWFVHSFTRFLQHVQRIAVLLHLLCMTKYIHTAVVPIAAVACQPLLSVVEFSYRVQLCPLF